MKFAFVHRTRSTPTPQAHPRRLGSGWRPSVRPEEPAPATVPRHELAAALAATMNLLPEEDQ